MRGIYNPLIPLVNKMTKNNKLELVKKGSEISENGSDRIRREVFKVDTVSMFKFW